MPLSILVQLRAFGPARRPLAIAIYASSTTMGPQLAACIGAWGVQRYGWTAVLWASLVPGLVSLATGIPGLWREPVRWRPLVRADVGGLVSPPAITPPASAGSSAESAAIPLSYRAVPRSRSVPGIPLLLACIYLPPALCQRGTRYPSAHHAFTHPCRKDTLVLVSRVKPAGFWHCKRMVDGGRVSAYVGTPAVNPSNSLGQHALPCAQRRERDFGRYEMDKVCSPHA